MKKNVHLISIFCITGLSVCISLILLSCEKYDKRTYYDTVGVGYVFNKETKEPVAYATVNVSSLFNGLFSQHFDEYYSADAKGYFSVKFLKRTKRENVAGYTITAQTNSLPHHSSGFQNVSIEDVQKAIGVLQVDTVWLYP